MEKGSRATKVGSVGVNQVFQLSSSVRLESSAWGGGSAAGALSMQDATVTGVTCDDLYTLRNGVD